MEREKIKITDLDVFGDITGYGPWHWDGQIYEKIEKIHQHNCDGECWDTIIKRQLDGKYFKLNVWDTGRKYVLDSGDNNIIEVFPKVTTKTVYE